MRKQKVFFAFLFCVCSASSIGVCMEYSACEEEEPEGMLTAFRKFKEETLASLEPKSERIMKLTVLFKDAEQEISNLAGKWFFPMNRDDLASFNRLVSVFEKLKLELGLDVVLCVFSKSMGGGFIRQVAYRALIYKAEQYKIDDIQKLSYALILNNKNVVLTMDRGETNERLLGMPMRSRIRGYICRILNLKRGQVAYNGSHTFLVVDDEKKWLEAALKAGLSVPDNSKHIEIITKALANLPNM